MLTPRARSLLHAAFWAADTDRDGQLRDAEWHALAGRLSEASLLQQADSPAEACDLVGGASALSCHSHSLSLLHTLYMRVCS